MAQLVMKSAVDVDSCTFLGQRQPVEKCSVVNGQRRRLSFSRLQQAVLFITTEICEFIKNLCLVSLLFATFIFDMCSALSSKIAKPEVSKNDPPLSRPKVYF